MIKPLFATLIFAICILCANAHVDNIVCGRFGCFYDNIRCNDGEPCNVTCIGNYSCTYSNVYCPDDWSCQVHCDGKAA